MLADNAETQGVFFSCEIDGVQREFCDEERALAHLLMDGVLLVGQAIDAEGDKTAALYVICNDIFAWACADAEPIPHSEIGKLYRAWEADKAWGTAKWCAKRRNQQPQPPVVKYMKEAGAWDDEMERLGPNTMDAETQELFRLAARQMKSNG